mgnify:CR=1 FL=1
MGLLKKIFSLSYNELKIKVRDRIKTHLIAKSVKSCNPFLYGLSYQIRIGKKRKFDSNDNILIVGCSGAIGNAFVKHFKNKNINLFGTYYKNESKNSLISSDQLFQLDLKSPISINNLVNDLKQTKVIFDLIVVASGDFSQSHRIDDETKKNGLNLFQNEQQTILNSLNINTVGPYLLFKGLVPLMREKNKDNKYVSQFCILTSSLGTMYNEIYGGLYPYRVSKGALHSIFLGVYCDIRKSRDIGILMAGPGSVKSKMNPFGITTPEKSAKGIIKNLEYSSRKANYQFLGLNGKRIPW